jgi:polysaccharide deacetylase 2 family uncharacterized protein YibQ
MILKTPPLTLSFLWLAMLSAGSHAQSEGESITPFEKQVSGYQSTAQPPLTSSYVAPARLAIIIDDLGNSLHKGLKAIALPAPISFAVMPHRKYSKTLAERAGRLGRDVLLHAPMSTINGRELGAGALSQDLSEQVFKDKLRFSIANTPFISGVNNHMGSQLTTEPQAMKWVMDVLKEEQLFFVDSRTHARSIGYKTAFKMGLSTANRDIFLDHEININSIHIQFKKALAIAKRYGSAIAIGHPHDATLTYLNHVLPQLDGSNVAIHSVSDLLKGGMKVRPDSTRENQPANMPSLDALVNNLLQQTQPAQIQTKETRIY